MTWIFNKLYFTAEHNNAENCLQECGWHATSATFPDLFANAGIPLPQLDFGSGAHGVVHSTAIRD